MDTLFIQLHDPPAPVKLDRLPLNVVPLAKNSITTTCNLPDNSLLDILCSQPDILPNFAMTDFASQGKTQGNNVVDLRYTQSHQGYYTLLSRSTSGTGTLILGGFHPSKITGGASEALHQEFCELELLDDITTLHYKNKLSLDIVMADHRNTVISLFRKKKGLQYMPSNMHNAIQWNKRNPFIKREELPSQVVEWRIVGPVSSKETQPASEISANNKRGRLPTEESTVDENEQSPRGLKRHGPIDANLPKACAKRLKSSHDTALFANTHLPPRVLVPIGTQWENNSCAYDAVCTVLFNIWHEDLVETTLSWNKLDNNLLNALTTAFKSHVVLQLL